MFLSPCCKGKKQEKKNTSLGIRHITEDHFQLAQKLWPQFVVSEKILQAQYVVLVRNLGPKFSPCTKLNCSILGRLKFTLLW